jgi:hypothetical protein
VSSFASCGVPFRAVFYSKDLILEVVYFSYINLIGGFLYFLSAGLFAIHSTYLVMFCGDFNLSLYCAVYLG